MKATIELLHKDIQHVKGSLGKIETHLSELNGSVRENRDARKRFENMESDIKNAIQWTKNIKFSGKPMWAVFIAVMISILVNLFTN